MSIYTCHTPLAFPATRLLGRLRPVGYIEFPELLFIIVILIWSFVGVLVLCLYIMLARTLCRSRDTNLYLNCRRMKNTAHQNSRQVVGSGGSVQYK